MNHEDLSEPGRYDDAAGWQPTPPPAKHQKLLADYKKAHPEEFCRDSIFETRPANECTCTAEAKKQSFELFGSLWRTGELTVMVGESGVGKSLLAVQIAESMARGTGAQASLPANAAFRGRGGSLVTRHSPRVTAPAQPVLYLDLEHSDAQFGERYRCPSPIPGKLPVRYRFSSKLSRTTFGNLQIPDAFRRDVARYYRHSLSRILDASEAKVLIIDNLSLLDPRSTGPAAAIRTMQMLKRLTLKYGYSILVLHSSPPCLGGVSASRGRGGSSELRIPRVGRGIYEIADSVFAIGRSTFAPAIRYIKPLKVRTGSFSSPPARGGVAPVSGDEVVGAADGVVGGDWAPKGFVPYSAPSSPVTCHSSQSSDVLVYQLARTEGPEGAVNGKRKQVNGSDPARVGRPYKNSPPYEGGVAAATPLLPEEGWTRSGRGGGSDGVVLSHSSDSSLVTRHLSLETAKPFLGFTYLGTAAEADLIRDYERERREAEAREQSRLRKLQRSSREILVDGIIDGSYARYLKGE